MFSTGSRLRSAAADTFALVVYCFVIGMAIEILISGMTFQQSLSSRLVSIPVNILIAWPYGVYRDAFIRFAHRHAGKHFKTKSGGFTGIREFPVTGLCVDSVVGRR